MRNKYHAGIQARWGLTLYAAVVTLLLLVSTQICAQPGVLQDEKVRLAEVPPANGNSQAQQNRSGFMAEKEATKDGRAMASVESAVHALRLAADKAKELGYNLDKHLIRMTQKEAGGWEIYFHPQHEKKGTRGGGITVHIDPAGAVGQIQRWR